MKSLLEYAKLVIDRAEASKEDPEALAYAEAVKLVRRAALLKYIKDQAATDEALHQLCTDHLVTEMMTRLNAYTRIAKAHMPEDAWSALSKPPKDVQ